MQIKKHQLGPLRQDIRLGVILIAVLALLFGLYLVSAPNSATATVFSFIFFVILIAPFVLAGNPTLIKVLRNDYASAPNRVWQIAGLMWLVVQLYALLTGQFGARFFAVSLAWTAMVALSISQLRRLKASLLPDYLLVVLLWLPLEFGVLNGAIIPPLQGAVNPLLFVGLVLMIYAYLVVREFEVGYTFRLSGEDYRVVVLDFLLFFFIAVIIGMLTGFVSIARHMPPATEMLVRVGAIFFFIALPEELLFRGVIFNLLKKQFAGQRFSVRNAMIVSSVLFGLAHGNNANPPFIDIPIGATVWHFPWAYVLLATIAGFFYCFVFIRTGKVTAAALMHLLVDWVWYAFFD